MRFPDDPTLLRPTRQFAAHVIGGEIPDDLQPDVNNLLGFAKNFYLQFFSEEHGIDVSGFNREGRGRVRPIEATLRRERKLPALLLVSHYLTMAERLDQNAETSDVLDADQERDEVFAAIGELLDRIHRWAEAEGLPALSQGAQLTHDEFNQAATALGVSR